jgi:DNA-binding transcriptional ArsR family regulator
MEKLDAKKIEKIAGLLKTVAHPLRLSIVELLAEHDKLTVSELGAHLACEQSHLSHNLNYMKLQGVLTCQRDGQKVYYSLKLKQIITVIDCLRNCACGLEQE